MMLETLQRLAGAVTRKNFYQALLRTEKVELLDGPVDIVNRELVLPLQPRMVHKGEMRPLQ